MSQRVSDPGAPSHPAKVRSIPAALFVLSLSMTLSSLGTSIANVALPTLARELGASFQEVQWVVLAYLLVITSAIVGAGRLGDTFGPKRVLRAGLALYTSGSLLAGLAPALWLLIVARAVQGLGAAAMMALSVAFVGALVPKDKTGRAMGLLGTTSAVGTALGPTLGGVLVSFLGWPAIFLLSVPLGLVGLALGQRYLPADRPSSDAAARIDRPGTALLAAALATYALAVTLGRGELGLLNVALLLAAAALAALFVIAQRRSASPLLRLELLARPRLRASLGANLLVSAVLMTTLVVGPFYLSLALELDPGMVGMIMSTGPGVAALTGGPAGKLVDRAGAEPSSLGGVLGVGIGALLLAISPASLGVAGYVLPLCVMTAGYGLFQAANNTAVMQDAAPRDRGVLSGTLSLSRNLGLITGASVMGAVFAFASGARDLATASPAAIATGMHVTFAVSAALSALALILLSSARSSPRPALEQRVS